jgi:hypothetical protein
VWLSYSFTRAFTKPFFLTLLATEDKRIAILWSFSSPSLLASEDEFLGRRSILGISTWRVEKSF